jgi:hypothetical protein
MSIVSAMKFDMNLGLQERVGGWYGKLCGKLKGIRTGVFVQYTCLNILIAPKLISGYKT